MFVCLSGYVGGMRREAEGRRAGRGWRMRAEGANERDSNRRRGKASKRERLNPSTPPSPPPHLHRASPPHNVPG